MRWGDFRRTLTPMPRVAPGGTGYGSSQMLARVLGVGPVGSGHEQEYTVQHGRRYRTYRACSDALGWSVGGAHARPNWIWHLLDAVENLEEPGFLILDFTDGPWPTLTFSSEVQADRLGFGTLVLAYRP